jgi:hypothetical protein
MILGATEPLDHPGVRGEVGGDALDCEAGPSGSQGYRNEHLITKVHIESHARVKVFEEPVDGFACDLFGRLASATQCAGPAKTVIEFGTEEQRCAGHSAFSHARSTCASIPRSASNTCARAPILSTMCWGKLAAIDRPHMRLIGPRSVIASGRKDLSSVPALLPRMRASIRPPPIGYHPVRTVRSSATMPISLNTAPQMWST